MTAYSTLPGEDLRQSDVRDTLRANGGTVTDRLTSFFKEAANLNKWSKYKPVGGVTLETDPDGEWYKGTDLRYGLSNFPATSVYTELPDLYASIDEYYTYIPPVAPPFRLMCFRHYYAGARCPVTGVSHGKKVANKASGSHTLTVSAVTVPPHPQGYSITLSDLFGGLGLWFGAYVKHATKTQALIATGSASIADNGGIARCELSFTGAETGTYNVYPFFASGQITQGVAPGGITFYPLPADATSTVECVKDAVEVSVSIYWSAVTDEIDGETVVLDNYLNVAFSIVNNTGGSITLPKLYLHGSETDPCPYLSDTEYNDYKSADEGTPPRPPGFPFIMGSVTIADGETYRMEQKGMNGYSTALHDSGGYWLLYTGHSVYTEYRGSFAPCPPEPSEPS